MVKNKVKNLMTIILTIIITMVATKSFAENNYTCRVQLLGNEEQKNNLKKGESITILVKAADIDAGDGIAAYSTVLEYDDEIFSCKATGDDDENWSKIDLIENVLTMKRSDMVANGEDQIITKIVLTAKEDAPAGSYTFKLTKISFTAGEETFTINDVSTTISIVDENGTGGQTPGGNDNGDENDNGNGSDDENKNDGNNDDNNDGRDDNENGSGNNSDNDGGNSNDNGNNGDDENRGGSTQKPSTPGNNGTTNKPSSIATPSSSEDNLPKTGLTDWLIVFIILGIISSIIFYIKYKKAYKE